jgi:hypothetical protein
MVNKPIETYSGVENKTILLLVFVTKDAGLDRWVDSLDIR